MRTYHSQRVYGVSQAVTEVKGWNAETVPLEVMKSFERTRASMRLHARWPMPPPINPSVAQPTPSDDMACTHDDVTGMTGWPSRK